MAIIKDFNEAILAYFGKIIDNLDQMQSLTLDKISQTSQFVLKFNPQIANYARKLQNILSFIDNVHKNGVDLIEDLIAKVINPRIAGQISYYWMKMQQKIEDIFKMANEKSFFE